MFPNASIVTSAQHTTRILTISMEYRLTLFHHTATLEFFLMTSLNFTITLLKSPTKLTEYLEWLKNLLNTSCWHNFSVYLFNPSWSTVILLGAFIIILIWEKSVEKVQWRAIYLSPPARLHDKSHTERLTQLSLPSVHYRQLRLRWPNLSIQNSYQTIILILVYWFTYIASYLLHNYHNYYRGHRFILC